METIKLIIKCILGLMGIIIAFAISPFVLGFVVVSTLGVVIVQCLTHLLGELLILFIPNKTMSEKPQYLFGILLNLFPKIMDFSETTTKEKIIIVIASIIGVALFYLNFKFLGDFDWIPPVILIVFYLIIKYINQNKQL